MFFFDNEWFCRNLILFEILNYLFGKDMKDMLNDLKKLKYTINFKIN